MNSFESQPDDVNVRKRKRMTETEGNSSKLTRYSTQEMFEKMRIQERQSNWTERETVLLILCQRFINVSMIR